MFDVIERHYHAILKRLAPWATVAVVFLVGMSVPGPAAQAAPSRYAADNVNVPTRIARARVAAETLMSQYDSKEAWWPSSWWNSAVAIHTIGDYMDRTGDRRFLAQVDHTFETYKGEYTTPALDDTEWWGLAWIEAYDLTHDQKYLDAAKKIATYVYGYWDPSTCGGGVWWNTDKTYKNAVTNGLFIRLAAELHNRIPGDTVWLSRAKTAWKWFLGSGMINAKGLVNDGLTDSCQNNGQTVWSYNQGLAIGAGLAMWRATGDAHTMATVRRLADAAIHSTALVSDGILTESCDASDQTCDDNAKQFKGIFMRYMMDLADVTHDPQYRAFIARQAHAIWTKDRKAGVKLGERWSGATNRNHPNIFDWRTQASALSALIAVIPKHAWSHRSLSATLSPSGLVVMPAKSGPTSVPLQLTLGATGPRYWPLHVRIQPEAPNGWSVHSRQRVWMHPDGDAKPVSRTIPASLSIPAGATDGHHTVSVDAAAWPGLKFTAQTDVFIAHHVDFTTGTAKETPWLFSASHSQVNGIGDRFADRTNYFIYRFPFPSDTTAAQVTLTIDNEFLVQASSDGEHWTTVLEETQPIRDSSNKAARTIDVTPYLGSQKAVYVRIADSFPEDGWGGRVYHVSAAYQEN